jgi:hypothetical protein
MRCSSAKRTVIEAVLQAPQLVLPADTSLSLKERW